MKRVMLSAAALLATSFFVAACDDDDPGDPGTTTFTVALTRGSEIAACTGTPGALATGNATVVISADNDEITITDLDFSGLSGAVTASHFHFGGTTVAGPVVINIGAGITTGFDGEFDENDYDPQAGTPTAPATFAAYIAAVKTGSGYINLHTTACPLGEIRGNLINPS